MFSYLISLRIDGNGPTVTELCQLSASSTLHLILWRFRGEKDQIFYYPLLFFQTQNLTRSIKVTTGNRKVQNTRPKYKKGGRNNWGGSEENRGKHFRQKRKRRRRRWNSELKLASRWLFCSSSTVPYKSAQSLLVRLIIYLFTYSS